MRSYEKYEVTPIKNKIIDSFALGKINVEDSSIIKVKEETIIEIIEKYYNITN